MGQIIEVGGQGIGSDPNVAITFRHCAKETVIDAQPSTPFVEVAKSGARELGITDDFFVFSKGKPLRADKSTTLDMVRNQQTSCFGIAPRGIVARR